MVVQRAAAEQSGNEQQQLREVLLANIEETRGLRAQMQQQEAAAAAEAASMEDFQVECAPFAVSLELVPC